MAFGQIVRVQYQMASNQWAGSVFFSTTTLLDYESLRFCRAVFSLYRKSTAFPTPWPKVLVGVFTLTKMTSLACMASVILVVKNRLRPRTDDMISESPG